MQNLSIWEPRDEGIELWPITVGELLDRQAAAIPGNDAIIYDDPQAGFVFRWTYRDLHEQVERLAATLLAWGIARGDHVALMSANRPEWILLEYALAKLGAVLITVNPAFKREEIRYILAQGRISTFFVAGEYRGYDIAAALAELMPDLPGLAEGAIREGDTLPDLKRLCRVGDVPVPGAVPFAELEARIGAGDRVAVRARQATVKPEDIFQIQYTSGTTGAPKGAMIRHFSAVNNARLSSGRAGFTASERLVSPMPYFHTAGSICNVLGMCTVGGCHIGMSAFDAGETLRLIDKYRGTVMNGAPTMFVRMLEHPLWTEGKVDLSSLRILYTGGTIISPALMTELNQKWGADPMIIMGMTECSPIITQTNPEDDFETKISTAGTPLPHTGVMVADPETDRAVPIGEKGELRMRGYLVTPGYFDMPERTRDAFTADGWFRSGDLAIMHEGGYIEIVGRLKDMLIRGGENIYPVEIEEFLQRHPAIAEAQVVAAPDKEMGEEVFAFVVRRPGAALTAKELRDHCRANLARHKLPRYIAFVDGFPLTPSGKVKKFELRDLAARLVAEGKAE